MAAGAFYKLLEVPISASTDEIKRQYRKLSLKYHPDRGGTAERMVALNEAYQVLSDASRRRQYDMELQRATEASRPAATHPAAANQPAYATAQPSRRTATRSEQSRPSATPRPPRATEKADTSGLWSWGWAFTVFVVVVAAVELYAITRPLESSTTDTVVSQAISSEPSDTTTSDEQVEEPVTTSDTTTEEAQITPADSGTSTAAPETDAVVDGQEEALAGATEDEPTAQTNENSNWRTDRRFTRQPN